MLKTLTCRNIGDIDDGRAEAVINRAIEECVKDLEDRGQDGKVRSVKIEIEMQQGKGEDRYLIAVHAGTKRPGFRTADHAAQIRRDRGQKVLAFQEYDNEDPGQQRIEDVDENTQP